MYTLLMVLFWLFSTSHDVEVEMEVELLCLKPLPVFLLIFLPSSFSQVIHIPHETIYGDIYY
jgi:hypothetical protein